MTLYFVLAALLVVGIVAIIYYTFKGNAKKRLVVKMIDSSIFLVMGISALFVNKNLNVAYSILVILGGVLSFLGDLLLGINYNKQKDMRNKSFVVGGFSFFFAQLFFSAAFIDAVGYKWYLIFLPVIATVAAYFLTKLERFNVIHGKLKVCALGYISAVTLAFTCALGFVIHYGFNNSLSLVSLGGLFFLVSDCLLLVKYFFKKSYKTTNIIYLSTYYIAEAIYMLSVLFLVK